MDSVRSEYSDSSSSLGTGRFGGGAGGGSASATSLSFVDSSPFGSSRASTTRSDFLSNYEHKFLARKHEKKKKREREQRLADATTNQLTADDKRRADRERERLARRAEMATWLPTPAALRQRELDRKKRSRDALRGVLQWYPPPDANDLAHEAEDARVAAATGQRLVQLTEQRKRRTEIQPLFLPDSAHAQHAQRELQQRALRERIDHDASDLQRRVADLQQKMRCVEQLHAVRTAAANGHAKTRVLAPLHRQQHHHHQLRGTQSDTALPVYVPPADRRHRATGAAATATTHVSYLFRDTPAEAAHAQALEAAELDAFLDSHKRERRRTRAATKLQATWRMVRVRRRFLRWRRGRLHFKRAIFQVWALSHRISKQAQRAAKRKYLRAWRDEVASAVRLRRLELRLFREAELLPDVPKIAMNLVFMADVDEDDAYTRKVLARPMKASYVSGFVNAAFARVEQLATLSSKDRVRVLRAQHLEARRAVAKKVCQQLFLLWKRVHADEKRIGLNAQLCIKRAARQAFQHRPVWAGEKLLTVFELWARYAAFTRSKRLRVPLPVFATPLPLWDVWLHNYLERHVRKVKAAAKAPLARMRRCFRGFRAFARFARRKRLARERATRHFALTTTCAVLLAWRDAIAADAARKKRARAVLGLWHAYAKRKHAMRPWKEQVAATRWRREQQRAWSAWRNVQLRSCFRRELHRAQLMVVPAWRAKVQRLLLVWMDLRTPLRKWTCFTAWRQFVQRRKLFLTLRAHGTVLRRKHLLYGVFGAWKAVVWKQEDAFLEDRLQLSAWDTYKELAPLLPMLFYGCSSDAAAIFAGIPTAETDRLHAGTVDASGTTGCTDSGDPRDPNDTSNDVLLRRQHDVRAFHAALLHGSVVEARNLILSQRHLINGVDMLTGNTALHVATGQLEEDVRRIEITTLLLSEGACSWDTRNRHGLTPAQLTADDATRRLLQRGVYAFHADGILQRAAAGAGTGAIESDSTDGADGAARLVWCLVARMSSEYVRGERIAGDVRRAWHSELQDELWLRRGRVCFASTSVFSASIHRCRAFLNGMKRRICRGKDDAWLDLWTRVQQSGSGTPSVRSVQRSTLRQRPTLIKSTTRRMLSRDLARMEEKIDLLSWLKNTPDDPTSPAAIQKELEQQEEEHAQARAREKVHALGELGAYAEALLWPVLHDETAERELVPSFVGVLVSMAFSADAVLAEAARLEDECAALEGDVLQGYQMIMRAELRCRRPELPHGLPLLRYFTEPSDAEFFFKRELLLLNTELWRRRHSQPSARCDGTSADDDDPGIEEDDHGGGELLPIDSEVPSAAALQLEAEVLLARAQRKLRKVDKKVVAVEQQVAALADADARVLLAVPIENSRPRLRAICDARMRLETERLRLASLRLKQLEWTAKADEMLVLKRSLGDPSAPGFATSDIDADELRARRTFLEAQLKQYTHELKPMNSSRAGGVASLASSTTELRRLHKVATKALWSLFIHNLFRSCCCWLAENLLTTQETTDNAVHDDVVVELDDGEAATDDEGGESIETDGAGDSGVVTTARVGMIRKQTVARAPSAKRVSVATIAEPVTSVVATTFAAVRKASAATQAPAVGGGGGRRRSSVSNARAVLDTMQRSAAASELAEIQNSMMRENYASSSQLLFESDRDAMLAEESLANEREMELQHPTRSGTPSSVVAELNPITGLPETPSSRLMDADEVAAIADRVAQSVGRDDEKAQSAKQRNRKRELLRRAMAQRQLQRLAARQVHGEEASASAVAADEALPVDRSVSVVSSKTWAPLVDGVVVSDHAVEAVGFGNFVVGAVSPSTDKAHAPFLHTTAVPMGPAANKTVAAALAESLWKRGGTVRRPGDSPSAGGGGGSGAAGSASSPSSTAVGGSGGFELFASAEDEMAFNAAFRVMSASKERRASPNGRRLSSIGAVAGSGLGAVSAQEGADSAVGRSGDQGVEEAVLDVPEPRNEWPVETNASALEGFVENEQHGHITPEHDQASPFTDLVINPNDHGNAHREDRLLSDIASLVTPTDETEFFDQTLQHYLDRVRRDSFVGPKDPRASVSASAALVVDDDANEMSGEVMTTTGHENQDENEDAGTRDTRAAVAVDAVTEDDSGGDSGEQLQTPHIKWEPSSDAHRPLHPLHVESTRLLVASASAVLPHNASSRRETAALADALCEVERGEEEELRRLEQQEKQPFALSGRASVMAVRRQKSALASTLLKTSGSSKRILATGESNPTRPVGAQERGSVLRDASASSLDEPPASPSIPKIMVAIQRKASYSDEPPVAADESGSPVASVFVAPSTDEKIPSPLRRLSQPLPVAQCDLQLEPAAAKTRTGKSTKSATTSRRRPSHVESEQRGVPSILKKQPSRVLAAAAIDLCLEGASALAATSTTCNTGNKTGPTEAAATTPPVFLPELTEQQKRNVWRDFTAAPLSDAMQDAYAQLYPHLYEPVTPLPSAPATPAPTEAQQRRPSAALSDTTGGALVPLTLPQQIALDKRFWSAVEGFKAVGSGAALVPMDEKAAHRRRVETAVAIYQQFLGPNAPDRLPWLPMYSDELRAVEKRLLVAPHALMDTLQQTAQLHISTQQAEQRQLHMGAVGEGTRES